MDIRSDRFLSDGIYQWHRLVLKGFAGVTSERRVADLLDTDFSPLDISFFTESPRTARLALKPIYKSALGITQAWYSGAWWLQLLRPLSALYDWVRRRRLKPYQTGKVVPTRTSLPVVVVGNITVGGTGKTPMVSWLVETLREAGFSPGIVLRGYGGALSKSGTLVPSGADPERYSDEAVQLRDRLACPVAIAADRIKGLRLLETQVCDIAIADDGLQHYAMARDLEIAVVDGTRGLGNGLLLPAGPLREPVARLDTVDWVIANGEPSNLVKNETVMSMRADGFYNLVTGEVMTPEAFVETHSDVHAVCGIGNPNRFFQTLQDLGLNSIKHIYSDHYNFNGEEVRFDDTLPTLTSPSFVVSSTSPSAATPLR